MAYTNAQKAETYTSVSEKLVEAAVELRGLVDSAGDEDSEEIRFAQGTANTLTNLVGSFKVRAKESIVSEE